MVTGKGLFKIYHKNSGNNEEVNFLVVNAGLENLLNKEIVKVNIIDRSELLPHMYKGCSQITFVLSGGNTVRVVFPVLGDEFGETLSFEDNITKEII